MKPVPSDGAYCDAVWVVVPTRNPGRLWPQWVSAMVQQQPKVPVLVIDSASDDGTRWGDLPVGWRLQQIPLAAFNHGGTRNLALSLLPMGAEVVVFMTQDALLHDSHALKRLVAALDDPALACVFGRQLPHADATPIAAHARLFNYPATSRRVTLADAPRLGIKTCFLSNSFAAYRVQDLLQVGGFPPQVILGEDTAVAARLLQAGKAVQYQADACVFHSHNHTVLQEFRRSFDIGVFHARESGLLRPFGSASGEGFRFVKSELRYLLRQAPGLIPSALWRTGVKLLGYRLGRAERWLPRALKRRLGLFHGYWDMAPRERTREGPN